MKRSLSESVDRSSPESAHLVLVPRHQVDASRDAWNASSPSPLKRSKNRPGQAPRNSAGQGVGTSETESRMLAMLEEQLTKFEQRKDAELKETLDKTLRGDDGATQAGIAYVFYWCRSHYFGRTKK